MAEHSNIYILRARLDEPVLTDAYIQDFKEEKKKRHSDSFFYKDYQVPTWNYVSNTEFINIDDKRKYDILLDLGFCSTFRCLREEFNLGEIKNSTIEINVSTAKEMRQAIKYLLNYKYSDKVEEIMDNYYIKVFGSEIPEYEYRKNKDIDVATDDYFSEEGKYALKKLLVALNAFIWQSDEYCFDDKLQLKLIYCVD